MGAPHRSWGSPTRSPGAWSRRRPPWSAGRCTRVATRADWPVGQSGLEEAFEERLRGRPGGELLAGSRVLARAQPRPARAIRTTIHTGLQEAAVVALAGRLGGVAALDPRNGEIRALAGIAFSAPQPPGSTFKIVTTAAALEHNLVKPSTEFPVETNAVIDGVELENANGEFCGGTFRNSFAHSCNSVFAPLGLKIGAPVLVEVAERFGWNAPATIPGEVPSTMPPAAEIDTPLEVASTAIGQFETLATPLQMASVAQAIAMRGVRHPPTLRAGQRAAGQRVVARRIARTIGSLMVDVVAYGTGTAAAIPGVRVAGKTGTAELEDTRDPETGETLPPDPTNTDAWFTAYAPAKRPQIVVAVMLVRAGAGGATAAPAARVVLDAALPWALDIQFEGEVLVALALNLELQRAVLRVLERQPEQEHRARGGPELRDAARLGDALVRLQLPRVVREGVVLGKLLGLELVALGVHDLEVLGRLVSVLRAVADLDEHAVERLAPGGLRPVEVRLVRRDLQVELPRNEDVVLHALKLDCEPLAGRLLEALVHV